MNSSQSIPRRIASTPSTQSWRDVQLLRDACDEFLELRREPSGRATSLVAASAVIGRHSVLVLVHGWSGGGGKRDSAKEVGRRSLQSRKSQHLLRMAKRFKRPVVVCVADPPSKSIRAARRRAAASPFHLLSQWMLDVPVILFVSAAKVSFDIFGTWLADRTVGFAATKYILDAARPRTDIDAKELLRHKILDEIIGAPPGVTRSQGKTASYKVRRLLIRLLDDVVKLAPIHLHSIREERLARLERLLLTRL